VSKILHPHDELFMEAVSSNTKQLLISNENGFAQRRLST